MENNHIKTNKQALSYKIKHTAITVILLVILTALFFI